MVVETGITRAFAASDASELFKPLTPHHVTDHECGEGKTIDIILLGGLCIDCKAAGKHMDRSAAGLHPA